jgi:hypothetical protein
MENKRISFDKDDAGHIFEWSLGIKKKGWKIRI